MPETKVGLYLRLSREDEDCESESQSITNQRAFLQQYVAAQGWTVVDTYVDDGFTGTNFDRPDFLRMIADIEAKRINTVITKDLSRLGRDYIQVGHYLQRYFPEKGVRYIAVGDQYDSAAVGGVNMMMPFLSVINDMYAQDISKKVRSALDTRKNEGKFIGSSAPFGYQKDPEDRGVLLIDQQAAVYVQQLFWCYLSCASVIGTAKWLTEQGIPTPSEYKKGNITPMRFPGLWSDTMVRRILTNPTYAGHLTQNRAKKINYKLHKKVNLPQEDWVTIYNTHAPIICQEDFDRVQAMLLLRSYQPTQVGEGHLLTGMAFCADCSSPMTYVRESETRTYMVCQGYRKTGRLRLCTSHCIREDYVLEAIRQQLCSLAQQMDVGELGQSIQYDTGQEQVRRQMDAAVRKLQDCTHMAQTLYLDRTTGRVSPTEFDELFDGIRKEREQLEPYIVECQTYLARESQQNWLGEQIRQIISFGTLDRGTLATLLERVIIHENKTIQLQFRFQQP